eukprot:4165767-Amphidinium_carterae.2
METKKHPWELANETVTSVLYKGHALDCAWVSFHAGAMMLRLALREHPGLVRLAMAPKAPLGRMIAVFDDHDRIYAENACPDVRKTLHARPYMGLCPWAPCVGRLTQWSILQCRALRCHQSTGSTFWACPMVMLAHCWPRQVSHATPLKSEQRAGLATSSSCGVHHVASCLIHRSVLDANTEERWPKKLHLTQRGANKRGSTPEGGVRTTPADSQAAQSDSESHDALPC